MKIYFDTCVWIRPYELPSETGEHAAIKTILQLVKDKKLRMFTSRQVESELNKHVKTKDYVKFRRGLSLWRNTEKEFLPYPACVLDDPVKGVIGESRLNDNRKFQSEQLKSQDKDIVEFLVGNGIDYFISVDGDFTDNRIERVLNKGTKVLKPVDFVKNLNI